MTTAIDQQALFRSVTLPPLPAVPGRVFNAIQSGGADAKEVAELIETDPAFSILVLKLVNSAYYGLPVRVANVRFAIAYLGLQELANISLALSVNAALAPRRTPFLDEFWVHSYQTSLVARRVLKRVAPLLDGAEEVSSAALLHDVGRLLYEFYFPEEHARIMAHAAARKLTITEAEQALGLVGHGLLGGLLARYWQLPKAVEFACLAHDLGTLERVKAPKPAELSQLAVLLANALCSLSSDELSAEGRLRMQSACMRLMQLDEGQFLVVMADVYDARSKAEQTVSALL
jgi:HD-like signal output (HDOD) protein